MTTKWKAVTLPGGWDGVADEHGMVICNLVYNEPKNANLIAAAPELLAALEEMWAISKIIQGSPYEQIRKNVLSAIAKAKGKS